MIDMKRPYKFVIYKDRSRGWRWRLKSPNGKIVGDGGEAYTTKAHARRAVASMISSSFTVEVI